MTEPQGSTAPDLDVAIVGGGIAGLAAAWHLRHRNCVVLEAQDRPGGRIFSIESGGVPINLGAHMVPQAGTVVGDLVADSGITAKSLPPTLFGLQYDGRRHLNTPSFLLPALMRLTLAERLAFARLGIKLRAGAARSIATGQRRAGETVDGFRTRMLGFEDHRTLADLAGPLPERVAHIFRCLTERTGAEPSRMSAGHGLRSFANVWQKTAPGTNLVGGTNTLPAALARGLGAAFRPGHKVQSVERVPGPQGALARIAFRTPAGPASLTARACILATPASVTIAIARDLPAATRGALERIRYGAFLSLGVRLRGAKPLPWQDTYAIATPGLGFSVLFNHDAMQPGNVAKDGHSVMLFRGATGAADWIAEGDAATASKWVEDLETHFPEARGRVCDVTPMPWPTGAPFAVPGRAALQPALVRSALPFALAGDYLEFPNLEAAAASGVFAAADIDRFLSRKQG